MRISIFVSGLNLIFIILASALDIQHSNSPIIYYIATLSLSIQTALSMLLFPRLGILSIIYLFGTIISMLLNAALLYLTNSLLGLYITLGVVNGLLGVLALTFAPSWLVSICSAFSGSYLAIRPIGFWFG